MSKTAKVVPMVQLENTSGLHPFGRAVLVRPYEPDAKRGLIHIPDAAQERMHMIEQRAVVVELGPLWVKDEPEPRCKPGDHVMISRMAGSMIKGVKDGVMYRLVNHQDIYCGLSEESSHE